MINLDDIVDISDIARGENNKIMIQVTWKNNEAYRRFCTAAKEWSGRKRISQKLIDEFFNHIVEQGTNSEL